MSGLNLTKTDIEFITDKEGGISSSVADKKKVERNIIKDWLAMYDLLKEIAKLLRKWEDGKFYTSISSKDLRSSIRALIGGE